MIIAAPGESADRQITEPNGDGRLFSVVSVIDGDDLLIVQLPQHSVGLAVR